MIEQRAIVREAGSASARVEVLKMTASCGGCASNGCGVALFSRFFGNRKNLIELKDVVGVSVGDEVVIGITENTLLLGAFRLYAFPLVGLLSGAMLGQYLQGSPETGSELFSILGAAMGLLLTLALNYLHQKRKASQVVSLLRISPASSTLKNAASI